VAEIMKIKAVHPHSPVFGQVRPGYQIKSINGKAVLDSIDFRFRITDEKVNIVFVDPKGQETRIGLSSDFSSDLGLTLEDDHVIRCKNNCIFCFVHQQPKGMRRSLYIKDEDYRLSFTHGNFITLSHEGEQEIKRIIRQRLSPLYVSVHTTDDKLRLRMLGSKSVAPILKRLRRLTANGITIHTQVVLCPGINDGAHLEKTIDDLSALYPGVASLAVVPVGLTRYRENLPKLRKYQSEEARNIVRYLGSRQKEFLKRFGSRFVWPADEFYLESGIPIPSRAVYEDMPQFENGVGMVREFITAFNRRRSRLRDLKSAKRVLFLTGRSAHPFLESQVLSYVRDVLKLKLEILAVDNRFWGDTVTVSGLLTGKDLVRAARSEADRFDTIVLPPNCLNKDDLFLDDMTLEAFRTVVNARVVTGKYNLAETLKEVFV